MKKRGANLADHLQQALDYWTRLVPNRPRYVILCNFDEFRIYDFDVDISEPQDTVQLTELPTRRCCHQPSATPISYADLR